LDKARQTIWIRQIRSGIGCPRKHKVMLRCLGLTRLHKLAERPDTPQIRGLVAKVQHLVEIVKASNLPARSSILPYTVLPPEVSPIEAVKAASPVAKAKEAAAEAEPSATLRLGSKVPARAVSKIAKPAEAEKKQPVATKKSKPAEKKEVKKAAASKAKATKPSKTAKK
jgi:large subunit ribosomal protein L30